MKIHDHLNADLHPTGPHANPTALERYCTVRDFADDLLANELQSVTIRGRTYVTFRMPSLGHDHIVIPFQDVEKLDGQASLDLNDALCWLTIKVGEYSELTMDMRDDIRLTARHVDHETLERLCDDVLGGIRQLRQNLGDK